MGKAQLVVQVIEGKDLLPAPATHFKSWKSFQAYCVVSFQGSSQTTKEATQKGPGEPLSQWNQSLKFSVDAKKAQSNPNISVVVWQKVWKEYFEANKDVQLGTFEVSLLSLQDNRTNDTWYRVGTGYVHICITRTGLDEVLPQPVSVPIQSTPSLPPKDLPYAQQQSGPYYPAPQAAPQAQYYPPAPQAQQYPPVYPQNPQYPPQYAPQQYNPVQASAPGEYYPPVHSNPSVPAYVPQSAPPPLPPKSVDESPPKVQLPDDLAKRTIVANTWKATEPVTKQILSDYFRFCGSILFLEMEGHFALIGFEKDFQADTGALLDNGMVCGGPIETFRYNNAHARVPEQGRGPLEKLAKKYLEIVKKNPSQKPIATQELDSSQMSPEDAAKSLHNASSVVDAKVFVTNLSNQATVEVVVDFFTYCGPVTAVTIYKDTEDAQCATVFFESIESVNTALLLSNAWINDKPVVIQLFTADFQEQVKSKKQVGSSKGGSRGEQGPQSKTSVIASMKSAGYNVGSGAVARAQAWDDKHWNSSVSSTIASAKAKVGEWNEKYEISKKATESKDKLVSGFKGLMGKK